MIREEARKALLEGKKVRHYNFTRNEYLVLVNGRITTEDGFYFGDMFDGTDWMADGWSVVMEAVDFATKAPDLIHDATEDMVPVFINGHITDAVKDAYKVKHDQPVPVSWADQLKEAMGGNLQPRPRLTDEAAQELFSKIEAADPVVVQEKWRLAEELANTLVGMLKENAKDALIRKGRKMMKELRPGKIVYYVHGLGEQSWITKYKLTSKPYDADLGLSEPSPFVHALYFYKDKNEYGTHDSHFSLDDCNVVPNHYNDHRLFLTPQAAKRYLEWAKLNTQAPSRDDDDGYGWGWNELDDPYCEE